MTSVPESPDPAQAITDEGVAVTGPAAAVSLAAGIGALALGILTTLSEASVSAADSLRWDDGVGPLSGKTIIAAIVFFVSWAVLGAVLRKANPPMRTVGIGTAVLVVLGLLGTFPTFFQAFA